MRFLHVKFIADFRTMLMACSGRQFGLCRWFTYRTIILPTMGWGSGVVSSWCFCTKLRFMNIPVAPESRSADVETDVREVREVSSTWMLREGGEFFDRT